MNIKKTDKVLKIIQVILINIIFILLLCCTSICYAEQTTYETHGGHFIIDYYNDPADPNNGYHYAHPSWILLVEEYLEEAWNYLIEDLNFELPPGTAPGEADSNKILVEIRDLETHGERFPALAYWGSPQRIKLDNDYANDEYVNYRDAFHDSFGISRTAEIDLRMYCFHEFFHCVQQSYILSIDNYMDDKNLWLLEGTAKWIEDEACDNINLYLDMACDFIGNHHNSLDSISYLNEETGPYATVLFWKFLTEKTGPEIIRTVFENFRENSNESVLEAVGKALGDPAPDYFGDVFKRIFSEFTAALFMKDGPHGFQDDGASLLSNIVNCIEDPFEFDDDLDDFYIDTFNTSTGHVSSMSRMLDHLTFEYIPIPVPASLEILQVSTNLYLKVDGHSDSDWGFWAVKVRKDGSKELENIPIDSATFIGNITIGDFGGNEPTNIEWVILVSSRLTKSQDTSDYRFVAALSDPPYLQKVTATQGSATKYDLEWEDMRRRTYRRLKTNNHEPFSTSPQDVYISLEFNEAVLSASMNVAGRQVALNLDDPNTGNTWTGTLSLAGLPRNQALSIEVTAQDYASNNLDGFPHTPTLFNFEEDRWDNYEDANAIDTHIGGIDNWHAFRIATEVHITVRDPNGNIIPEGGRTLQRNDTIEVEVDEDAGITGLEVRSGDFDTGQIVFSDNTTYGRRHIYNVSNLPVGLISIRALDDLGGEGFHGFQVGAPTTPIESAQERIFVSNRGIWGAEGREGMGVTPIRITPTGDIVVEQTIPLGGQPADVVIRSDGQRIYVANVHGYISVLEYDPNLAQYGGINQISPYRVFHTIETENFWPFYLAITPDGSRLYAGDQIGNIKVYSTMYLTKPSLNPVDADLIPPHTEMDSIEVLTGVGGPIDGHFVEDLTMSPDGTCLYALIYRSPPDARLVDWEHQKKTYVAMIDTELISNPTIAGRKIWRGSANHSFHTVLDHFEIFGYYSNGTSWELNVPVEIGVYPDGDYIYVLGAGTNCGGHAYARHLMDYRAGLVIIDPQPLDDNLRRTGYSMGQAIPGSKFYMTREIIPGIRSFYEATRALSAPGTYTPISNTITAIGVAGSLLALPGGASRFALGALGLGMVGAFGGVGPTSIFMFPGLGFDPFIAAGVSPFSYEAYEPSAINDARSIAISPDGQRLWVSFNGTSNYSFMNIDNPLLPGPYEAATMAMETVEHGNFFPYKVAYSYDGRYVFGTNRYSSGPTHWQGRSLFLISDDQVDHDMQDVRYFYRAIDLNDYEEELIMSWEGTQVATDPNGKTRGYWSRLYPGHTPLPSSSLWTIQNDQMAGPECIGVMGQIDSDHDEISNLVEAKNRFNQEFFDEDQVPYSLNPPLYRLELAALNPIERTIGEISMALGCSYGGVNAPDQSDPSEGELFQGILLPTEGIGYRHHFGQDHYNTDNAGTLRLIKLIEDIGREWIQRHPEGPRMIIDDLSRPGGGQFLEYVDSGPQRHTSHQNGSDVDVWYFRKDKLEKAFDFVLSNETGSRRDNRIENINDYDPTMSTELINIFLNDDRVRSVWVDPRVVERASELNIPLSSHAEEKLVVRGAIDGLENGSRRDMDSYFLVSLFPTSNVDLDIEGVHDNIEESVGRSIYVNNDDDNESGIPDNEEPILIVGENDLVKIIIQELGPYCGTDAGVLLDKTQGADKIEVWTSSQKETWITFNGMDNFFHAGDLPVELWVEGVSPSDSERDAELTLSYEGNEDRVRFTVQPRHIFTLEIKAADGVSDPPGSVAKDGTITFTAVVTPSLPGAYSWRAQGPSNTVSITGPQNQPTITLQGLGASNAVNDVSLRVTFRPEDTDQRQMAFHSLSVVDIEIKAEDGVSPPEPYIALGQKVKFKAMPKPSISGNYLWTEIDPGNRIEIKGSNTDQKVSVKGMTSSDPFNDAAIRVDFIPESADFEVSASHTLSVLEVRLEPRLILLPDPAINPNINTVDLHVNLYNADETFTEVTFDPRTSFEVTIPPGISQIDLNDLIRGIGPLRTLAEEFEIDMIDTNIIANVEINPATGQLIAHTSGINIIRAFYDTRKTNRSLVIVGLKLDSVKLTPQSLINLGVTPLVEKILAPIIDRILNTETEAPLLLTSGYADISCIIHLYPDEIEFLLSLEDEMLNKVGKLAGAAGYLFAEATFSIAGRRFDSLTISSIGVPDVSYLKYIPDIQLSTFLEFTSEDDTIAKPVGTVDLLQSELETLCGDICGRIVGGAGDLVGAIWGSITSLNLDPASGLVISVGSGFTNITGTLDMSSIPGIGWNIGKESDDVLVIVGPELTEIRLDPNEIILSVDESSHVAVKGLFTQNVTIDGEEDTLDWEWPIPDQFNDFHPEDMDDISVPGYSGLDLRPQVATISSISLEAFFDDPNQAWFDGGIVTGNSIGETDIFCKTCLPFFASDDDDGFEEATGRVIVDCELTVEAREEGSPICPGEQVKLMAIPDGGTEPYTYRWSSEHDSNSLDDFERPDPNATPEETTIYTVTVVDVTGCTAHGSVEVRVRSVPTVDAGPDQSYCTGSPPVEIGGSPTAIGGTGSYSYSWSPSEGLNDPNDSNPLASPSINTTYTVTVTDTVTGCTAEDSVQVNSGPIADAGPDQSICLGDAPVQIGGSPTASEGTGPYTYSWNPPIDLDDFSASNPFASPDTDTNYTVTVTDMDTGCTAEDSVLVRVNSNPTADAGPDHSICLGDTNVQIGGLPTASGGSGSYTYNWIPIDGLNDPSVSNPFASPDENRTYTVMVTDTNTGCTADSNVQVTVNMRPIADAGLDISVMTGDLVTLDGSGSFDSHGDPLTYAWSQTLGSLVVLSNSTDPRPTFNAPSEAAPVVLTFELIVNDGVCGDSDPDSVNITVIPPSSIVPGTIVINEVVTDPEQDWSSVGFTIAPGGGFADWDDQWIEIYNAFGFAVDLTGWTITMTDGTPSVHTVGIGHGIEVFSTGSNLTNFLPDGYLVIGNPDGVMGNNVFIELRDRDGSLVNNVEIGNDPEGDGAGDGAPSGLSTGLDSEAVSRFPNGAFSDVDSSDFVKQTATIGGTNNI